MKFFVESDLILKRSFPGLPLNILFLKPIFVFRKNTVDEKPSKTRFCSFPELMDNIRTLEVDIWFPYKNPATQMPPYNKLHSQTHLRVIN